MVSIAQANLGIATLNRSGMVGGTIAALGSDSPTGLAFDPAGNPQILLQDNANVGNLPVRRYTPDLSAMLFETSFFAGTNPNLAGMGIDPAGIAYVWGGTSGVDLAGPCYASLLGPAAPKSR